MNCAPEMQGARSDTVREAGSGSYAAVAPAVLSDLAGSAKIFPGGLVDASLGDPVAFQNQGHLFPQPGHCAQAELERECRSKEKRSEDLIGARVLEVGPRVQQWLLEVMPLRSQPTGKREKNALFPLPTSSTLLVDIFPDLDALELSWLCCICMSLNSLWGGELLYEGPVQPVAQACLKRLVKDVKRVSYWHCRLEVFDWDAFFSTRGIDYRGDEVKTARDFTWKNISPALPAEIGRVPLADVCTLGAKYYVEHFEFYLRPPERWEVKRVPRVMVPPESWAEVCQGLVQTGVCALMEEEALFHIGDKPLLNGLFGVSKDEWVDGHEVFRLIMNLTPLNGLVEPIRGDVDTLPMWSLMNPFFLQPDETLLISSEDVRCFFYTLSVPQSWWRFLGFNRPVPDVCLPSELKGRAVYLVAKVLPMGFANSVSLAQHVHRNLALWSAEGQPDVDQVNLPEAEIRKDRAVTTSNPSWRIYLDNYDLLEKVKAVDLGCHEGHLAPAALALRQEYEFWEVPRNLKKSVSRQVSAEVQGAQVDGAEGVAFPREVKLLKYLAATLSLLSLPKVTQRQVQVVCGGLVYVSMFRRQLLGCLNSVWKFIESFDTNRVHYQSLPAYCQLELVRFLGLLPLARLDFRLEYHEQVTCSDASTLGGGVCASTALSRAGCLAAQGKLRGELPELRHEHRVLCIGLFDGIGALRVACDLLGLQVLGHVGVEIDAAARRVVTSHFPEAVHYEDVRSISQADVQQWARDYSQASLVIIGAGPPCQGVSGLNASRKGALRDERSGPFPHVKRIWLLVQDQFPWCQVHCLMESVASMDQQDREVMSQNYGNEPWNCDAGSMTWCHRPRLYWISWELVTQEGVELEPGSPGTPRRANLYALQDLEEVCKEGWIKTDPDRAFPTFTTSRPRDRPGHKPAGLRSCTPQDLDRWAADSFRFPPYQYTAKNLLIDKHDQLRMPSIEEKEYIMGFPVNYTQACLPKAQRGTIHHLDVRHSQIGNTWRVPVIAWLLGQLCGPLGLCPLYTPQQLMDFLNPMRQAFLQSRLWRAPLRPLRGPAPASQGSLVSKLGGLISVKGEDILLTTPSSQLTKFHRLRASVPARLWKWRVIAGWRWTGSREHINSLELRAVLTSLKWRIQHRRQVGKRFLHLVDSLVVLHALSRGRSSSKKLRSTLSRINALLLCSSNQALWGYVQTDQNPADRPSRWGSRVKSKFRHA